MNKRIIGGVGQDPEEHPELGTEQLSFITVENDPMDRLERKQEIKRVH